MQIPRKSPCLLATAVTAALCTAILAGPVKQTNWSAGATETGPVLTWSDTFADQTDIAWRSIEGQLAIAGSQRGQALREVIAQSADLPRGAAAADFNGDGLTDVAIGDPVTDPFNPVGAIYLWLAEPDGSWTPGFISETFYGVDHLTSGDVDGDGDIDLVVAAYYGVIDPPPPPPPTRNGRYAWFENIDGSGTEWAEHVVGELYCGAEYVDVGDFDGDGDIDLVGASYLTRGIYEQESDITWFENLDGAGHSWDAHEVSIPINNGYEAHFADLDGDGDLDILATHADLISWWENSDGAGDNLIRHDIVDNLQNVGYVNTGDIDNDGDLDIVGSTYSTSTLFWWENYNGQATLWVRHIIGAHPNGEQVEIVDVEGDGDLDVVADRREAGRYGVLTIFTNTDGRGFGWSGRTVSIEQYSDYSIAVADVDTDGKIDVLVASEDYARQHGKQVSYFDLAAFGPSGMLTSSVLDAGPMPGWGAMTWDATIPGSALLTVEVRGSNDPTDLGGFVDVPQSGAELSELIDENARYVQYRLGFVGSADASPILREIVMQRAGNVSGLVLTGPAQGVAGQPNELVAHSTAVGSRVIFAGALSLGETEIPPCPGVIVRLANPMRLGSTIVDENGEARISVFVPRAASGRTLYFQAVERDACVDSNVIAIPFD